MRERPSDDMIDERLAAWQEGNYPEGWSVYDALGWSRDEYMTWLNDPSRVPERPLSALPPGRPEEFHLQPPTEPCVNLSIYTARPSHSLPPRDDSRRGRKVLLPISRLASTFLELGHPLRSTPVTGASSLLLDDPPPSRTSVLSPFVFPTYRVFPWHCTKSSQVPSPSPDQSHATYTPDTTWPISRHPPC